MSEHDWLYKASVAADPLHRRECLACGLTEMVETVQVGEWRRPPAVEGEFTGRRFDRNRVHRVGETDGDSWRSACHNQMRDLAPFLGCTLEPSAPDKCRNCQRARSWDNNL